MKKSRSVARLLVIALGVGILIYTLVLSLNTMFALHNGLSDYFEEQLPDQATVVKEEILFKTETNLNVAHYIQENFQNFYPEYGFDLQKMDQLAEYAVNYFNVTNATFYNANCVQVSSPTYGSIANIKYLAQAVKGTPVNVYEYEGGRLYSTVMLPLKSDGQIFGAISVRTLVSNEDLIETITEYSNVDIAFFYGDRYFLTSLENMEGEQIAHPEYIEQCSMGTSVTVQEKINGVKYISYYFPFQNVEGKYLCTIFIGKHLDAADAVASKILLLIIPIVIIATIIVLIVFYGLIRLFMIRPLKKIDKAIENLSSGDADLTARIQTKSNDEFAHLGENINKFIEMLQQLITQLGNSQETLNEVGMDLGSNAQESASATAQILANIESVRHQVETQNNEVNNTSTVLEQSSQVVDELTALINDQTSGITESSAAIEEMLSNINTVTKSVEKMSSSYETLNKTVDDGQVKLSTVDQKVQQISEQSRMLIQANTIISQIASETNLLAMNAAIEASHAGEAGKGFSVVADEIRKLAENSSVQSKAISSELKKITSSIDSVVQLSSDSQTAFRAIVDQIKSTDMIIREINNAMEEQSEASKQIYEALSDMKDQSVSVSDKSKAMAREILNVARDMNSVSQISSTITGSMDEMTIGMQQIGSATQNVSDLANQTRDQIGDMNSKLTQFTI